MGVADLALTCGSESVWDTVCLQWLAQLDAGSDREDRSSDVCYVGGLHFWLKSWTTKICTVPKVSQSRSEGGSSRDNTHPSRMSLALAMVLTMNARRFQKTRMGVIDIAHICGSEINGGCSTCCSVWLSLRSTQILVTRSDPPMYALLATHDDLSLKVMVSSSCTLIVFAE